MPCHAMPRRCLGSAGRSLVRCHRRRACHSLRSLLIVAEQWLNTCRGAAICSDSKVLTALLLWSCCKLLAALAALRLLRCCCLSLYSCSHRSPARHATALQRHARLAAPLTTGGHEPHQADATRGSRVPGGVARAAGARPRAGAT